MNFIYNFFKNNDTINEIKNENDDGEDDSSSSSSSSKSEIISSTSIKQFPNYIIIHLLNIMINQDFKDFITIDYDFDIKSGSIINFLKLSLVSKNWDRYIIPFVKYPIIKIRFLKDIEMIDRWISKGISKYPLVNMCQIEIDLPNQYASTFELNNQFKNLLRFKEGHVFEKLKISTAIVHNDVEVQSPSILMEFIVKHSIKELELHNIPAIKNPMFKETIPLLNYSLFPSVADLCSIQHLILKNQLLSCERIIDLMDLFPKLQTLDLTNNRIGIDYNQCFTYAISTAVCLTTLKIGSNVLKNNIKSILETLKENCYQLKTLDISENYIQDDESANAISNFIETNKTIENLNLSGNLFDQLDANKIIGSLSNNCSSHLISLGLSNLQSFNASLLSDYLLSNQCNKLKYLNISNSKLIPGELGQIFKSLIDSKFQSLISFDISYCKINDQDELQLLSTLLSNSKTIEKIKLLNVFKTSIPCKQLLSNLSNSITDLDLSLNYLNDTDCIDLSEVLSSNKSIRNLNLTRNKIRNIQPIFDSLKLNTTLSNLNLSGNSLTLADVSLEFLLSNSTLTNLNLAQNSILDIEMTYLFKQLVLNESITTLDISNNKVTDNLIAPNFRKRKTKLFELKVSAFLKSSPTLLKACLRLVYENENSYTLSSIFDSNTLLVKELSVSKRKAY